MSEPELTPRVIADRLTGVDGVAFDPDGHVWCGLREGALVRIDAETRAQSRIDTGGSPRGIAIDVYGRVWFADGDEQSVRRYDPDDRKLTIIVDQVDDEPLAGASDLAFDARGQLLVACSGTAASQSGFICCVRPDGSIEQIANVLDAPSSLVILHGGQTLVIAEAGQQRLWRGEWDDDECLWTDDAVWAQHLVGRPGPAGMAMSIDGRLYVAISGEGKVIAITAEGFAIETFALPSPHPMRLAFDPNGQLGLVISDAEQGTLVSIPGLGPGVPVFDGGSAWAL